MKATYGKAPKRRLYRGNPFMDHILVMAKGLALLSEAMNHKPCCAGSPKMDRS